MRPFEIALVAGELLTFLVLAVPRLQVVRWMRYAAVGVVGLAAAQVILEGPRWQMVPAYVLTGLLGLVSIVQRRSPKRAAAARPLRHRIGAGVGISLGVLGVALAAALPTLLPVFHFAQPTGPYGIGTVTYYWVDTSRPNIFAPGPDAHRELMVQVWYPTDRSQPGGAPYLPPGTNFAAAARLVHLPSFFFDHLKYVTTNAQPSAPMAGGPGASFPVLIFVPGRGGYRANNTFQVEELVSQGYVIAGIDQPYTVADVVFPDGRQVELDDRVGASVLDERVAEDSFMLSVFDYLGQDAVFALNQLATLNTADPNRILTGRLDLAHAGIFGTSLGGIAAAEACRLDQRFQACLILDVAMPPDVVQSGLQQPTMWISEDAATKRLEGWTTSDIDEQETTVPAVFSSLPGDGYLVAIPGMFHGDISDLPYVIPPPLGRWFGTTGPTDWQRSHAVINAYSDAFFDRYLRSQPEPLLNDPVRQFPEITFERRP